MWPVLVAVILAVPLRAEVDRDLLLGLLRIPSVTKDQAQNNRAVEYMKGWLDAHGVFTAVETNEAGRAALYAATVPGKCHDIVFVTHLDVVPPSCDGQFEPVVKDGFVYGRGACDTKGNVAVIAQTLANLAGKGSVGAVFATDEETRTGASDTPTPTHLLYVGYVPQKFLIIGDTNGEFTDSIPSPSSWRRTRRCRRRCRSPPTRTTTGATTSRPRASSARRSPTSFPTRRR